MMVPAIIVWTFSQAMWMVVGLSVFMLDGITALNVAKYLGILALAYLAIPFITRLMYASLCARRMWIWGRSRFYNRKHMIHWMNVIGATAFDVVVEIDDRIKQEGPFLRLMRP